MKKIISIILVMILMTTSAFAYSLYADVPENNWAYQYIKFVSEKEYMQGFEDATFRAGGQVNKVDVIIASHLMLADFNLVSSIDVINALVVHQQTLIDLGFPAFYEPYGDIYSPLAYALEEGYINKTELASFIDEEGNFTTISKEEAVYYLGKMLVGARDEKINYIIDFEYNDKEEITDAYAPYIDLLIRQQIIGPYGDGEGNFNPKDDLRRDILAYLLHNVYQDFASVGEPTTPPTEETEGEVVKEGIISYYYEEQGLIELLDASNELKVYEVTDAVLLYDGEVTDLSAIKIGRYVKMTVEDDKLIQLEIEKEYQTKVGTLSAFRDISNLEAGAMFLQVDFETGMEIFKAYATTNVLINGKSGSLQDLEKDMEMVLYYDGDEIVKLAAYDQDYEITGELVRDSELSAGRAITVRLEDGTYVTELIEEDTLINKESARRGAILKIVYSGANITAIEATSLRTADEGIIKEIVISSEPSLVLNTAEAEGVRYDFAEEFVIEEDGLVLEEGLYGLRLDRMASISLKMNKITKLVLTNAPEEFKIKVTVTEVIPSANMLKVKDDEGNSFFVTVKEGLDLSLASYQVDNYLYVFGEKVSTEILEAELIILLDE